MFLLITIRSKNGVYCFDRVNVSMALLCQDIDEILITKNMWTCDEFPGSGLSKYRHQASHRNCAGTPSTLFGCIQQDPPTTPVLRKTPLQSFIVYTLVTLSTPSPESCTIIKILHTVHLKYYPLSVLYFIFVVLEIPVITQ